MPKKSRKLTLRHKSRKSKSPKKRKSRKSRKMTGGNYARNVTTATIEGYPSVPLNKLTVSGPGFVLSGSAYLKLMEDRDKNGID